MYCSQFGRFGLTCKGFELCFNIDLFAVGLYFYRVGWAISAFKDLATLCQTTLSHLSLKLSGGLSFACQCFFGWVEGWKALMEFFTFGRREGEGAKSLKYFPRK